MIYFSILTILYAELPNGKAIKLIVSNYPYIEILDKNTVNDEKIRYKDLIIIIDSEEFNKVYLKTIEKFNKFLIK